MRFEYLDHTADLKIKAYGNNLESAFENMALAATNFLTPVDQVKKEHTRNINISSERIESLLYDFLEELLVLIDTEGFLFSGTNRIEINKSEDGKYRLNCIALGDHYKNYPMKGDLKAVTYSEMKIEKINDGFEITTVYDI